jgi:hypothetical protein
VLAADLDDRFAGFVAELCDAHAARFLRIPPKSARPDLYYDADGHWRAEGHAYAARLITEELLRGDWLTRTP